MAWFPRVSCAPCHGYMPQFRAIGGPVGHAALCLETGRAACRSRTAQDANATETNSDEHGSYKQAGPVGWGEPLTLAKK